VAFTVPLKYVLHLSILDRRCHHLEAGRTLHDPDGLGKIIQKLMKIFKLCIINRQNYLDGVTVI
jgi:hypothetical protein